MLTPRLIARGAVYPPAVNRDGSKIIWSDRSEGTRDLFTQKDGATVRLTQDKALDIEPAMTPSGDRLVWSRRVNKDWDIYEMVDGKPQPLFTGKGAQRKPVFSADVSTLAFEDNNGIGVVRNGKRELIPKPEGPEILRKPRLSEDGRRVFYERYDAQARTQEFWMRDEDGVNKPILDKESSWTRAAVSRNGRQVTYAAWGESGGEDIFVRHLDTDKRGVIADKAAVGESFPVVTRDGETTYFNLVDYRGFPKVDAYIFREENGSLEELVDRHPDGRDLFPALSPDEKQMNWVWVSDDDPANRALYVMDVSSKES